MEAEERVEVLPLPFRTDWKLVREHPVPVMTEDRKLAIWLGMYDGLERDALAGRYDSAPVMQYLARHRTTAAAEARRAGLSEARQIALLTPWPELATETSEQFACQAMQIKIANGIAAAIRAITPPADEVQNGPLG